MSTDALKRFRDGLARGEFTMTEIAEATGIPLTTLSDMSNAGWRPKVFDRLEKLAVALDRVKRVAPKNKRTGKAQATA